jgi:hypothetical protein
MRLILPSPSNTNSAQPVLTFIHHKNHHKQTVTKYCGKRCISLFFSCLGVNIAPLAPSKTTFSFHNLTLASLTRHVTRPVKMCESWEFDCGHTTTIECQNYKNRVLIPTNKDVTDDDPSADTGALLINVTSHVTRVDSNLTCPFVFTLPSPTISSATSDTGAASSAPSVHRHVGSNSGNYGPGPAVENTDSLVVIPDLPIRTIAKISTCSGPENMNRKCDDQCYDCILQKAKDNADFQRDERDAAVRLYEQIGRQDVSWQR